MTRELFDHGDSLWPAIVRGITPLDALLLASVPLALVGVYLLPTATREALVFEYARPSIRTAFAAPFVHFDAAHLLFNLLAYALVVPLLYALSLTAGRRRQFRAVFVALLVSSPILLSYLNLTIVRDGVTFGFSGVLMAYYGYLPLVLAEHAESRLALGRTRTVAPLLFFVGLELSLDQLFSNRVGFARAGAMDVGISLPVGFALGLAFGFTWLEAAFIALIVFNSSTVSIAKSLIDLELIANPESDEILGVIVIEDILTALGFAVLSVFLVGGRVLDRPVGPLFGGTARCGVLWLWCAGAAVHHGLGRALLARCRCCRRRRWADGRRERGRRRVSGRNGLRSNQPHRTTRRPRPGPLRRDVLSRGRLADQSRSSGRRTRVRARRQRRDHVGTTGGVDSSLAAPTDWTGTDRFASAVRSHREASSRSSSRRSLPLLGRPPALLETIPAFTVRYVLVTSILGTILVRSADSVSTLLFCRR